MPAHLGRRDERTGRAERVGGVADRGEPGPPGAAAEHRTGDHQDGAVASGVEGEAAKGDRPGAGQGDRVLDRGAIEQFAQPLLAGREHVLAGRQRDPGRLTPADQPFAVTDPGQRGGFGEPAHQAARIGYGDGADGQPFRCRLALVTAAGFHACQLYVAATAAQVPGSARACRALPRPAGDHIPGRGRHRRARVAGSDSY